MLKNLNRKSIIGKSNPDEPETHFEQILRKNKVFNFEVDFYTPDGEKYILYLREGKTEYISKSISEMIAKHTCSFIEIKLKQERGSVSYLTGTIVWTEYRSRQPK